MDYKTKSIITVSFLVLFMLAIGFLVNNAGDKITSATTIIKCACSKNADCDDANKCTEDICLYPDSCRAALCVHKTIENCN